MIHAPFTLDQRVALQLWQDTPYAHPLTCGNCPCALPLVVEERGLVCGMCFHVQTTAPEECMTLPPDPAVLLPGMSLEEAVEVVTRMAEQREASAGQKVGEEGKLAQDMAAMFRRDANALRRLLAAISQ